MKKIIVIALFISAILGCVSEDDSIVNSNQKTITLGFDVGMESSPMARKLGTQEFGSYLNTQNYLLAVNGTVDDTVGYFNLDETVSITLNAGAVLTIYSDDESYYLDEPVTDEYVLRGRHVVSIEDEGNVTIEMKNNDFTFVTVQDNKMLNDLVINDQYVESKEKWYRHGFVNGTDYHIQFMMPGGIVERRVDAVVGMHHHYRLIGDDSSDSDADFDIDADWEMEDIDIGEAWCGFITSTSSNTVCNGYKIYGKNKTYNHAFGVGNTFGKPILGSALAESLFELRQDGMNYFHAVFYAITNDGEDVVLVTGVTDPIKYFREHADYRFTSSRNSNLNEFASISVEYTDPDAETNESTVVDFHLFDNGCDLPTNMLNEENFISCKGQRQFSGYAHNGEAIFFSDLIADETRIGDLKKPIIEFGENSQLTWDDLDFIEFTQRDPANDPPVRWYPSSKDWEAFRTTNRNKRAYLPTASGYNLSHSTVKVVFKDSSSDPIGSLIEVENLRFDIY